MSFERRELQPGARINLNDPDGSPMLGTVHSANAQVAVIHMDDGRVLRVSVGLLCTAEERPE